MSDFTHFNEQGRAKMVDVGEKPISQRVAVAAGRVLVNEKTFALIQSGGMKKGDVLTVAQIAGVMGAKRHPSRILQFGTPLAAAFIPDVPLASCGRLGLFSHTSTPCTNERARLIS